MAGSLLDDSTDPPRKGGDSTTDLEVLALLAVLNEDGEKARKIVQRMGRGQRAVLSFWLHELETIIDDVQMGNRL